jgi:hypothetical protein
MDRKTLVVLVVALAAGYWLAASPSSPVPAPRPNDRPVVRFLARVAKNFLWVALLAEEPPKEPQPDHMARSARIGDDGYPIVDHARGW